ncbi:MAG: hypothetical protein LJE67_15150 [Salaquimonas sp.]|nr:hypothetical protein [Salaquimonas sp.]
MKTRTKALFVTRHNNDFDSMAPVADGWAKLSDEHHGHLFVASPELAWKGDHRTAMLSRRPGVEISDLWDMAGIGGGWLERNWLRTGAGNKIRRKLLQIATERAIARGFDARMTAWLDDWRPDVIAFDWYNPPTQRKRFGYFGYQAIMAWARTNHVPIVSLPHGLLLFDPPGGVPFLPGPVFAATFVESQRRKQTLVAAGAQGQDILVAGAPRYDPAWVERVVAELGGNTGESGISDDRVAIVFFATKRVYDFDFDGLMTWLGRLAAHEKVDLVIQPHPRGQREATFAALARLPNVTVDAKTPASLLIDRAQIVSTLVSSVMVEAVVRGREILYPGFVNTVATRFEEKGACIALARMEDTHAAIDAFIAGKRVPRENYETFLSEAVYGGGSPDTIARICTKMTEIAGR